MNARVLIGLALGSLLACGSLGCDYGKTSAERGGASNRALAGEQQLKIDLPPLVSNKSVALGASSSFNLGDRTQVNGVSGSLTSITALGTQQNVLNADIKVGNVYSRAAIELRDRALVRGSLFTAGAVQKGNGVVIQGLTFSNVDFDPPSTLAWKVDVPAANTNDVRLEPDRHISLSPGRFRTVSIKSRSSVTLSAGDYFVESLQVLEPQAKLKVNTSGGKVKLYVLNDLAFRGALENVGDASKSDLMVVMLGTSTVLVEQPFSGFLIAPNATLRFRQTNAAHNGSFFAKRIESDAGTVFQHRELDFDDYFPPDDLVVGPATTLPGENGVGGKVPDGVKVELDLPEGRRACDPGLRLDSQLDGIELDSSLHYRDEPTAPRNCVADYQECSDSEQVLAQPSEPDLNRAPGLGAKCGGTGDGSLCGIDENTIVWDDTFGLCDADADCVLYGKVCAKVCLKPGCPSGIDCLDPTCASTVQHRCAEPAKNCNAQPTEGPCQEMRECAEPQASGDSNPANHTLTGQPASDLDAPPAQTPPVVNVLPSRPQMFEDPDEACKAPVLPTINAELHPEPEDRDMVAGNDRWGIIAKPTMHFDANAVPKPLGGEAEVFARGSAGLDIDVRLWGDDYNVFHAEGSADFETCKAELKRSLVLVGQNIAPGPGSNVESNNQSGACNPLLTSIAGRYRDLRDAQVKALRVRRYATNGCLGSPGSAGWSNFCEQGLTAVADIGAGAIDGFTGFPQTCSGNAAGPAMAGAWTGLYGYLRDRQVADLANLANLRNSVLANVPGSPFTFLDFQQRFTGFRFDFTYPVGPVTISVDIELSGGWGISGDLVYAAEAPPSAKLEAQAQVRPHFDATVIIFVGIGLGPVVVGVEGELVLLSVQTPLRAGVALKQRALLDNRQPSFPTTVKSAFESVANAPAGFKSFGPSLYDWDAEWTYGAGVHLESLSGQIDLAAKLKLLFFTKKWKVKLARWDALFTLDKEFAGTLTTAPDGTKTIEPKEASPSFGSFYENVAFADPNYVKTGSIAQNCEPIVLKRCTIVQ